VPPSSSLFQTHAELAHQVGGLAAGALLKFHGRVGCKAPAFESRSALTVRCLLRICTESLLCLPTSDCFI